MTPNSPARKQLAKLEQDIYDFKSAIKTNDLLLQDDAYAGISESLLTGKPWVFNIATQKHQQLFFIKTLKLAVTGIKKNGDASLGEEFLKTHENVPEIIAYKALNDLKKTFNTWLKGLSKQLRVVADYQDNRISASYDYLGIVTVRTSAKDPAFQTITNHGDKAKPIKIAFISPWLGILLEIDYNAHEIKMWGNLSKDKIIARQFEIGMRLRRELRIWQAQDFDLAYEAYAHLDKIKWDKLEFQVKEKLIKNLPSKYRRLAEILIQLQKHGDFHRNSYSMFFSVPAESVTKDQRQSVKQTSFGSIYGKHGETLGEDLNEKEVRQIKLNNPGLDRQELRKLLRPYHEMGMELLDRLFTTFKKGRDWILDMQATASKFYRVVSPLGPVRHLWTGFLTHKPLNNRADRQASNSINQGIASNVAFIGSRIFQTVKFKAKKHGVDLHTKINNMVHDSLKLEITKVVNLSFVLYFLEHSLFSRTAKACNKVYGFPLMIGLEGEFNLGFNAASLQTYAYTEYSFFAIIEQWIVQSEAFYGQEIPNKKALRAYLKDSYRMVEKHRAKELASVKTYEPETKLLLTIDKIKEFQDNNRDYQKLKESWAL